MYKEPMEKTMGGIKCGRWGWVEQGESNREKAGTIVIEQLKIK